MMINKKMTMLILLTIISISLVFAQEPKISINLVGFGGPKEVFISVHNTGEIPITNVKIIVDGNEYETVKGGLAPRKGFETTLKLDQGIHTIEALSSEGAHDSITVNVPELKQGPPQEEQSETASFLEKNRIFIIVGIIILFGIFLWLLVKPPKLKF